MIVNCPTCGRIDTYDDEAWAAHFNCPADVPADQRASRVQIGSRSADPRPNKTTSLTDARSRCFSPEPDHDA